MEIIETIEVLRVLDATQIERLFFSKRQSQTRRCTQLVNHKKLKRFRLDNWSPYIYYLGKKPSYVKSMLAISEFYTKCVLAGLNVVEIQREKVYDLGNKVIIIPDAVITLEKEGVEYEFFVEVDNTKELSTNKYYRAYKECGFLPPPIISISSRKRRNIFEGLEIIKLKFDLEDFESIFLSYF